MTTKDKKDAKETPQQTISRLMSDYRPTEIVNEGGIFGLLGRKRQGKSLLACAMALDYFLNGWPVFHNGSLRFGEELDVMKLAQLEYSDCVVFLDEAHAWLDSRRGQTLMSVLTTAFLTQIGKLNIWLLWATHEEGQVDKRLRFATDLFWEVEKHRPRIQVEEGGETFEREDTSSSWPPGTVLRLEITDRNGNYSAPGTSRTGVLRDMEKMFPLNDTRSLFAAEAGGRMDRQSMDSDRRWDEMQKTMQAILGFKEAGYERVTPVQVSQLIQRDFDVQIPPVTIGKNLKMMGLSQKKSSGKTFWDIGDWEPLE